jgi:hypothetical protein
LFVYYTARSARLIGAHENLYIRQHMVDSAAQCAEYYDIRRAGADGILYSGFGIRLVLLSLKAHGFCALQFERADACRIRSVEVAYKHVGYDAVFMQNIRRAVHSYYEARRF